MIIQHNIMAMGAYRSYMKNTNSLSKNLEKLSSGYRINRAGDDAAGLAISEKMRAQITGLDAAQKNVQDGISLVQTAEGALQEVQDMLNRMVYLATQSANGTYDNEVDRANLQKEVDALSTEIDRIADSSNFNGIKLLDGSLGMNTEAISVANKGAVEASDGTIDISALFGEHAHDEGSQVNQVNPSFTVDLTGVSVKHTGGDNGDTATVDVSFAGKTITLTLDAHDGGTGTNGTYSAKDLGDALVNAVHTYKGSDGTTVADGAAGGTHFLLGDFAFKAENTNGVVKFTFDGMKGTDKLVDDTTDLNVAEDFTKEQADALNALLGSEVKIENYAKNDAGATATLAGGIDGGLQQHALIDVAQAQAKVKSGYAGVELELTKEMVADGAKINIDGKEFTVTYDKAAAAAAAGNEIINLSAYEEGSAEAIHAAVDQLSNKTQFTGTDDATRAYKIGSVDDKTIRIDQRAASTGDKISADDLKGLISAKGAAVAAANATTTITLNADNLVEGNTITVDGKSFVFSKDPASVEDGTGVDINNAVADLAAKLTEAGFNATADAEKGTVTLEAADAESSAPVVLGKGLALQIGDTADNFNQLAVSVEDMHVDALGIGDIDISTQEGASVAIDKIKSAINSVSMTRGTLGATQNRLEHTANNLSVMEENIQDAESSIRDTDIAEEMMAYTKNNILIQSAQAMLAQANTIPQGVLQLLG